MQEPRNEVPIGPLSHAGYSSEDWGGWEVRWCLVNFQRRGVQLIWIIVGQGPTAPAVVAVGGYLDVFVETACIERDIVVTTSVGWLVVLGLTAL